MRLAFTIAFMALATACAGTSSGGGEQVRPLSVEPDRGYALSPTPVTIRGEGFLARLTQPSSGDAPVVDVKHRVWLDEVELPEVAWVDTRTLQATVPPGLPLGDHRLTVENAFGDRGTLDGAYTVLPAPSLEVALTVDPSAVRVGQMVTVTVTVTNASAANLISLGVGTPLVTSLDGARATVASGPVPRPPASLAAGQRLTASWTLQAAAAGIVSVTASVTATNPSTGEPVTAASSGASLIQIQDPGSAIVGAVLSAVLITTPSAPATLDVSQAAGVTLAVTNTGGSTASLTAVAPSIIPTTGASCVQPSPVASATAPLSVAPGATQRFTWTCRAASAGTYTLGATVVATDASSGGSLPTPVAGSSIGFTQPLAVSVVTGGTGSGTVASTPAGIAACGSGGGTCRATFAFGSQVTLAASPGAGSSVSWTGCDRNPGPTTCQIDRLATARSVGATFDRPPQALTLVVTKAKGASVSSIPAGIAACDRTCSASFGYGAQVTLTATLGKNASVSWVGCDRTTAPPGAADTCTLSMTSAKIITATFR